ncbi:LysR family transcriptional regulator [Alicyclobacillus kakegawensis]|uniref:LysR family transcriptional regulator n=1 Tax=Alicyclobacillus kakegawensis TaxID=392012 RepID=UPI000830CB7A|nr:LysR family transcriptional regulator [Alicyclobacillus kakegawensis]
MEIRLLEYFMVLARELSFTRAADLLGITQPTLSHQIQLLESRLNTRLFERTGKRIALTQSGQILLAHTRQVFYELEEANREIQELHGLKRGRLSIGCAGNHIVIQAVRTFHERYPHVTLSVLDMRTEETIEALLNHELDLGVIFRMSEDVRFEFIHLFDEEFYFAVSNAHRLADAPCVSWEDLRSVPLAMLPKRYVLRRFVDEDAAAFGVSISPTVELSSLESLGDMLSIDSIGAILTKSYIQQRSMSDIVAIPIRSAPRRKPVGLVYPKNAYVDETAKTFMEILKGVYAKER